MSCVALAARMAALDEVRKTQITAIWSDADTERSWPPTVPVYNALVNFLDTGEAPFAEG